MTAAPAETTPETTPETKPSSYFLELPVRFLIPHPKNVRADVGDVADLAASIKTQGVLQPLVVAPVPRKAGRCVVIAGHRRLAAAKAARLTTVPCVVREDLVDEAAQLQAMLVENGQRTDLTPVEEGDAYRALTLDYGVPVKDLAKNVGRSQQLVRGRITLAGSPESVRTRVIAGQVPIEQAIDLAEHADDDAAHVALSEALGSTSWAWTLQVAKDRKVALRTLRTEVKLAERSGWRLLTPDEWLTVDRDQADLLDDLATDAEDKAREAVFHARALGDGDLDQEGQAAVDAAGAAARAPLERDGHHTCPGHAGVVHEHVRFGAPPRVEWVCRQAVLHDEVTGRVTEGEGTGDGGTDDDREAAAARQREADAAAERRREQAAALYAAAKVRRRHLGQYVRGTDDKAARQHLIAKIAHTVGGRFGRPPAATWPLADVLDITFPPPREVPDDSDYDARERLHQADAADRRDVVTEALAGWTVLELVGLASLSERLTHDEDLTGTDPWAWRRATSWLQQVAATGYEWTPAEREHLPEGVAASADDPGEATS